MAVKNFHSLSWFSVFCSEHLRTFICATTPSFALLLNQHYICQKKKKRKKIFHLSSAPCMGVSVTVGLALQLPPPNMEFLLTVPSDPLTHSLLKTDLLNQAFDSNCFPVVCLSVNMWDVQKSAFQM